MSDPVRELKVRADTLKKRIASGDVAGRARMRALLEFAKASEQELAAGAASLQHKHCLAIVAREHGFSSWEHALRVLGGHEGERDFGTLLYVGHGLNVWYAAYDEARAHLDEARRSGQTCYLLAYRTQFFIVERHFIEALGLDPDDPDWAKIDFDWVRPADSTARERLYAKRLDALRTQPVSLT